MKVTKVSISYEVTINLGNYNNVKPGVSLEAQIEDGDEEQDVIETLFEQAKYSIAAMLKERVETEAALMDFSKCESAAKVESYLLSKSPLYNWIHTASRKMAYEDIAYLIWLQEDKRRAKAVPAAPYSGLEGLSLEDMKS